MAEIEAGKYTIQQIFDTVGFDFAVAEDDRRRVKVGGLGFIEFEDLIRIPDSASVLEITLDGEVVVSATVVQA